MRVLSWNLLGSPPLSPHLEREKVHLTFSSFAATANYETEHRDDGKKPLFRRLKKIPPKHKNPKISNLNSGLISNVLSNDF